MSDLKARLAYHLKHDKWFRKTYDICFSSLLKALGVFIKTDDNLVLINCFGGIRYADSPRALFEYIRSHHEYDDLEIVWAFDNPSNFNYLKGCSFVKQDSVRYFLTALKAKYWITNINIERGLHFKKKDTVYLNTWHGIPFKSAGISAGRDDYNCSNVTFWCAEGPYSEGIYMRDYRVRKESFLRVGIPRDDRLYKATEEEKQELKKKMGLPLDKKVIAYIPTWRESHDGGKSYELSIPMNLNKWQEKLSDEYVMLFRAHFFTTVVDGLSKDGFIKDFSSYPDINDIFIVSDILISDYSSVTTDFSILERPVICYGYDYDEYMKERGFGVNLKEIMPNGIFRKEDDVLDFILNMNYEVECKKTALLLKEEFQKYGKGNATEICVKSLFADYLKRKEIV